MKNIGRSLIGISCLSVAIFPFIFWFDDLHVMNPEWHDHARFHLMWNAVYYVFIGSLALFMVMFRWEKMPQIRWLMTLIIAWIWISYHISGLVITPALEIEPYSHHTQKILGIETNVHGVLAAFVVLSLGYWLDRRFNPAEQ